MTSVATYNKMNTSNYLEGTFEVKDYFRSETSNKITLTELEKNFLSFFAIEEIIDEATDNPIGGEYGFYYGNLDPNEIITDFDEIHAYLNRDNVVSKNVVKGIIGSLDKKNVVWVEDRSQDGFSNLIWLTEDFLTAVADNQR
tara:strand:- start:719 stop:1144 length:426 start_codon:yes stop_codon:yes gene_type:complete